MSLNADTLMPAKPSSSVTLTLYVKNLGHVPSFKNKKRSILDRNTGHQRTLTEGKTKKWMESCTKSFLSQLLCAAQTIDVATIRGRSKLSLIACAMPWDDSRQWIPTIHIATEEVEPGFEGAKITITPIP